MGEDIAVGDTLQPNQMNRPWKKGLTLFGGSQIGRRSHGKDSDSADTKMW